MGCRVNRDWMITGCFVAENHEGGQWDAFVPTTGSVLFASCVEE